MNGISGHSLVGQSRRKNQWRRPVVSARVQIRRSVAQKYFEDSARVTRDGSVKRRSAASARAYLSAIWSEVS